jgi:UDPglucose--hexose-1-phosphate uridylyltransferase
MSEIRLDPLSRRWVIIGGERAGRPNEFVEAATRPRELPCPFCAGHETETPPPVATYAPQKSRAGSWLVRVVPNKYPALTSDALASSEASGANGGAACMPGFGLHEVIIESPEHFASLSELSDTEVETVFTAYRDRIRALSKDRTLRYVQIFKNMGPAAGASLEHVHSQLLALADVPEVVQRELDSSSEYYREQRRPLLVDVLEKELAAEERVVAQSPHFVAFCPYASRFGYEVWVMPRRHQAQFEAVEDGELGELSRMVRDLIGRIESAIGPVAYNYFLHTRPFDMPAYDHYHWHIEIIPRLTKVAGFEWSTGCFINPYPPEAAAAHLRSRPAVVGRKPGR